MNQADVAAPKERRRREKVIAQDDKQQKKPSGLENSGSKAKQDEQNLFLDDQK